MSPTHKTHKPGHEFSRCEVRRHPGPLAREVFLVCRPDPLKKGISSQTVSAYETLLEFLRAEGGSSEHVVRETAYLGDVERDFDAFRNARLKAVDSLSGGSYYAPASTFVGQPPLSEGQLLEISAYAVIPDSGGNSNPTPAATLWPESQRVYQLDGRKHVFIANVYGERGTPFDESYSMLRCAEELLHREGMSFHDVVRTWIHLRQMERDYAGFNEGRSEFFRARGIGLLPASTGISGAPCVASQNLCLSLFAVQAPARIALMSSPTLNEAWVYGSAFSRGVKVMGANGTTLFISGTASVDEQGRTTHGGDFEAQAERMILNISTLLALQNASFRDVVSAATYLKDPGDAPCLRQVFDRRKVEGFPNAVLHAEICRPDLLCEMEVIAILPAGGSAQR